VDPGDPSTLLQIDVPDEYYLFREQADAIFPEDAQGSLAFAAVLVRLF